MKKMINRWLAMLMTGVMAVSQIAPMSVTAAGDEAADEVPVTEDAANDGPGLTLPGFYGNEEQEEFPLIPINVTDEKKITFTSSSTDDETRTVYVFHEMAEGVIDWYIPVEGKLTELENLGNGSYCYQISFADQLDYLSIAGMDDCYVRFSQSEKAAFSWNNHPERLVDEHAPKIVSFNRANGDVSITRNDSEETVVYELGIYPTKEYYGNRILATYDSLNTRDWFTIRYESTQDKHWNVYTDNSSERALNSVFTYTGEYGLRINTSKVLDAEENTTTNAWESPDIHFYAELADPAVKYIAPEMIRDCEEGIMRCGRIAGDPQEVTYQFKCSMQSKQYEDDFHYSVYLGKKGRSDIAPWEINRADSWYYAFAEYGGYVFSDEYDYTYQARVLSPDPRIKNHSDWSGAIDNTPAERTAPVIGNVSISAGGKMTVTIDASEYVGQWMWIYFDDRLVGTQIAIEAGKDQYECNLLGKLDYLDFYCRAGHTAFVTIGDGSQENSRTSAVYHYVYTEPETRLAAPVLNLGAIRTDEEGDKYRVITLSNTEGTVCYVYNVFEIGSGSEVESGIVHVMDGEESSEIEIYEDEDYLDVDIRVRAVAANPFSVAASSWSYVENLFGVGEEYRDPYEPRMVDFDPATGELSFMLKQDGILAIDTYMHWDNLIGNTSELEKDENGRYKLNIFKDPRCTCFMEDENNNYLTLRVYKGEFLTSERASADIDITYIPAADRIPAPVLKWDDKIFGRLNVISDEEMGYLWFEVYKNGERINSVCGPSRYTDLTRFLGDASETDVFKVNVTVYSGNLLKYNHYDGVIESTPLSFVPDSINVPDLYLAEGESAKPVVNIIPARTTANVVISANNAEIADVKDGQVIGKKIGRATITASYLGKSAEGNVYVRYPQPKAVYKEGSLTGLVGGAVYLIDNEKYTADSNGEVGAKNEWNGKTISIIRVYEDDAKLNSEAQMLAIPELIVPLTDNSEESAIDPVPEINAETKTLYLVKGQKFTLPEKDWKSANKSVLAVSKGTVTAKKATTTAVKLTRDEGKVSIDVYICEPKTVKKKTLKVGESETLMLEGLDSHLKAVWYTSEPDVATVSGNGLVKTVGAGKAVISAYVNGVAFSCTLKVKEDAVSETQTLHMTVGTDKKLKLKGVKGLVWTSDNEKTVKADKLKISAVGAGKAVLTGKGTYKGEEKQFKVLVTVEDPTVVTNGIVKKSKTKYTLSLKQGDTAKIEFKNLEREVVFKSSKPHIAGIGTDGTIKARKAGKTKIITKINKKTVTINVTVTAQ